MKRIVAVVYLGTFLLSACSREAAFPIPEGVQTVYAVLQPVPFSLQRRGTHALVGADGQIAAYAESTVVNLHALEGRQVGLQGVFERNIDPSMLPVLVVQSVLSGGDDLRLWTVPALSLSLKVPAAWKGSIRGQNVTFTASGYTLPVLSVAVQPSTSGSPGALYGPIPLPGGSASSPELLVVGLRKAEAALTDGTWTVVIYPPPTGGKRYLFTFTLQTSTNIDQQLLVYRAVLATVQFPSAPPPARSSASSVRPPIPQRSSAGVTEGSSRSRAGGEGAPCGGNAGILCPKGYYCAISDPVSESGLCRQR